MYKLLTVAVAFISIPALAGEGFLIKNGMRAPLFFIFLLFSCSALPQRAPASRDLPGGMREALSASTYLHGNVPAGWPASYHYDPIVQSVIASLYSREPARKASDWSEVKLPFPAPAEERFYSPTIKAYFRKGDAQAPLFVVIPGSYATWKRGSYTNRTVAELDRIFGRPSILAFPGLISPEFLKGQSDRLPWDVAAIGHDLFLRIREFARNTVPGAPAGAIGFSGGATCAIQLLYENALSQEKLFTLGATAFSPVLHQRITFENLDGRARRSQIPWTHALTSLDAGNLLSLIEARGQLGWRDLLHFTPVEEKNFADRFFNESVGIDLRDTISSVGLDPARFGAPPSYMRAYVEHQFLDDMHALGILVPKGERLRELFDLRTDVRPVIAGVSDPLLIYFSADDPILSNPDGGPEPAEVGAILNAARANRRVLVFHPAAGGHVGALVDAAFPAMLEKFFR